MNNLEAISPIDGRYEKQTKPLVKHTSEMGLIRYRLIVEGEYFISLSEHSKIELRPFSSEEKSLVRKLYNLSLEDAETVKAIERETNHDVKAVEYFMRERFKGTSLEDSLEWIHFALTSEDVNNIAYGLMLSYSLSLVMFPTIRELHGVIDGLAQKYKDVPMLARTHGQPASPTTFGKEFKVFSSRLERQLNQLKNFEISVKLNGATGNYNAHYIAYPEVDWLKFTKDFVNKFNSRYVRLVPNFITTQIESHDNYAELFDNLRRLNTVLIDFNQDIWGYISDGWIVQKPIEGEVGSSTMPHKVNPIDFENSEGNLGIANSLFRFFSEKLPISRFQRDLSDSTVERNFGVALGHSLIGYKSILRGLKKVEVNERRVIKELENHPEVISEAIQTVLRKEGIEMSYEQLKELTRGRKVTMKDLGLFIGELNVSEEIKNELRRIKPINYIGIANKLVDL